MKKYIWQELDREQQREALCRPVQRESAEIQDTVRDILSQVRSRGDEALFELTKKFDGAEIDRLAVTGEEFDQAREEVGEEARRAMELAAANLEKFHQAQMPHSLQVETMPGIHCYRQPRPLERVGLYIPGGTAVLFSTLIMLGVPSKIAGCPHRLVCTPPGEDGKVSAHLLVAAQVCGIDKVYKVGGAQAVAAMAYGTESIVAVDKIFGPGNAYVTAAKQLVSQSLPGPSIDLPAGPSEVLVIADDEADPEFVAVDLLSQAEHDERSQVVLVTDSERMMAQVEEQVTSILADLPRKEIAAKALENSRMILASSIEEAVEISNRYAPEHLVIQVKHHVKYVNKIIHAGSVFLGPWSPEAVGDYASGTNHVLPTYGYARSYSGVTLESFFKTITFQELTREGLERIGETVETLADLESLEAHRQAISRRLKRKD